MLYHLLCAPAREARKTTLECRPLEGREVPAVLAAFVAGSLVVTGDAGSNTIEVSRDVDGNILVNGGAVPVVGGTPTVANTTRITIHGKAGNDTLNLNEANGALPPAVMHGGAGDDVMNGGSGADTFFGGAGKDSVLGRRGDDRAFLGAGADVFVWNPGDGSDTIDGGAGRDEMLFNGAGAAENVDIRAEGNRVRFFRDVAAITMLTDDVELITFNALGGADNVVVHNLAGTDLTDVRVNLGTAVGSTAGDGKADVVTVEGTDRADRITVASNAADEVVVSGLRARVTVTGSEAANDTLAVLALGGNDTINSAGLAAGLIQFVPDLGT